jgi:hypothetical protein
LLLRNWYIIWYATLAISKLVYVFSRFYDIIKGNKKTPALTDVFCKYISESSLPTNILSLSYSIYHSGILNKWISPKQRRD